MACSGGRFITHVIHFNGYLRFSEYFPMCANWVIQTEKPFSAGVGIKIYFLFQRYSCNIPITATRLCDSVRLYARYWAMGCNSGEDTLIARAFHGFVLFQHQGEKLKVFRKETFLEIRRSKETCKRREGDWKKFIRWDSFPKSLAIKGKEKKKMVVSDGENTTGCLCLGDAIENVEIIQRSYKNIWHIWRGTRTLRSQDCRKKLGSKVVIRKLLKGRQKLGACLMWDGVPLTVWDAGTRIPEHSLKIHIVEKIIIFFL